MLDPAVWGDERGTIHMPENSALTVVLDLLPHSFEAEARFELGGCGESELSFLLNDDLTVLSVTDGNGGAVSFSKTGTETPTFRPPVQKITVRSEKPLSAFTVSYRGTVRFDEEKRQNWHNTVTPDFVSLNWYSAWFPEEVSVPIKRDRVIVKNGSDWVIVKGEYDEENDVWLYGGRGFDGFNIVAYAKEKLCLIESPSVNIYFSDERLRASVEQCVRTYEEIVRYYNHTLFDEREIGKLDVVCAFPFIRTGGAYRRKDLMWCVSPEADALTQAYLFAHETAHIWCCGADAGSWEDWLNETTAEWSALLFALDQKNPALFEKIIKPALEKAPSLPPIKTEDGSRPEGVHEKGTALFHRIYESCGEAVMIEIVRCFSRLPVKNTENLIAQLKKQGIDGAAEMIAFGIEQR